MEDLCQRIPSLAVLIFKNLDDQSLVKVNQTSRKLLEFVLNERFYLERTIFKYKQNLLDCQEIKKKILKKSSLDTLEQLASSIRFFFTKRNRYVEEWPLLHILAANECIELYKYAYARLQDKHPKNQSGWTPLHFASQNYNLEVCEFIMEGLENKKSWR